VSAPLAVLRAMLVKDLRRELRSKEIFISCFLFSVIVLCAFYFAVTASGVSYEKMGAGALWICILFSGTIGLNRTQDAEMANGCYRALILAPIDGGWIYLAKTAANTALLGFMTLLLLPLMALFFNLDPLPGLGWLLLSLILGVTAFTAVGTVVVAVAGNTRMKDALFPVVQLPLVVPTLVAGVNSTAAALDGESAWNWIQFLLALNLVFLSAGFLLYEFLLEE